jgi:hypothetical protein
MKADRMKQEVRIFVDRLAAHRLVFGSTYHSRPILLGVRPLTAVELLSLRRVKGVVRPALTPVSWREVIGYWAANAYVGSPSFLGLYLLHGIAY